MNRHISYSCYKKHGAFTLIEMSIVLVIIGLIIGGIVIGSDMIRVRQLQNIAAYKEELITAINTYRLKYNELPGDHASAESFFGAANTNNGNGNKTLDICSISDDTWLLWQHLSLAGLIEEASYTGTTGPGGCSDALVGTNVPESSIGDVGYYIRPNGSGVTYYGEPANHYLLVGKDEISGSNIEFTDGAWIRADEMLQFDYKFDNGIANKGSVRTRYAHSSYGSTDGVDACTTGAYPNHAYTGNSDAWCNMVFTVDF